MSEIESVYVLLGRYVVENEELKRKIKLFEVGMSISFSEQNYEVAVVDVNKIDISTKLRNALSDFGVKYNLLDIQELKIRDFRKIYGVGKVLISELFAICKKYNIKLEE